MRIPEIVALLGVNRKTVYEAVARDEIPHRRIGVGRGNGRGGVILFLRSAIMRWLSGIDEYPQRKVAMFGNYVTKRAKELGIPVIEARVPVRVTVTNQDVVSATKKSSKQCALARASARLPEVKAGYFFRTTAYLEYRDKMIRYSLPTSVQKEIVSFDRARLFAPGTYQLSPTSTATSQIKALAKNSAEPSKRPASRRRTRKKVQQSRRPEVVHRTQFVRRVGERR
jgi:predicted DNA-binding transcriptional regulator AlpA